MTNECNIIRDLFPLYREGLASNDTVLFVENHLKECDACRAALDDMEKKIPLSSDTPDPQKDITPLAVLKKKMKLNKIKTILISSFVSLGLFGIFFLLTMYGLPITSSSDNYDLSTEFQYNETGYLNQEFVVHLTRLDGRPLAETFKEIYETDEDGNKILVGYEITPRDVLFDFGQSPDNFTFGYSYQGNTAPESDFDFTITIKFRDKTVVYSMVKEDLFIPQEDISDK